MDFSIKQLTMTANLEIRTESHLIPHARDAAKNTVIALGVNILILGLLHYLQLNFINYSYLLLYLAILPVAYIAYTFGLIAGIANALAFGGIIICETKLFLDQIPPEAYFHAISLSIALVVIAHVSSNIASSTQFSFELQTLTSDWESFVTEIRNPTDIARSLIQKAEELCEAEHHLIILKTPIQDRGWLIVTPEEVTLFPPDSPNQELTFLDWVVTQDQPIILNHLEEISPLQNQLKDPSDRLVSCLITPFHHLHHDQILAWMVICNKSDFAFKKQDLKTLKVVLDIGEKTLSQAQYYARTNHTLNLMVKHLITIQNTSTTLYSTLDADQILQETLSCGIKISGSKWGFFHLTDHGKQILITSPGQQCPLSPKTMESFLPKYGGLKWPRMLSDSEIGLEHDGQEPYTLIISPFHLEDEFSGIMVLGSFGAEKRPSFPEQLLHLLLDQAMTAVQNSLLFEELQEEKKWNARILKSMSDGVIALNNQGQVIKTNPASCQFLQQEPSEILGKHICDAFNCPKGTCQREDCELVHRNDKQSTREMKQVIENSEGTKRTVHLTSAPLKGANDQVIGSVVLFRDITERDELDRLQQELITGFSHEMRTPLSNIQTIVETLQDDLKQKREVDLDNYSHFLNRQTQKLTDLFERILDVHNLETGKLTIQARPLPIGKFLEQTLEEWRVMKPTYQFITRSPRAPLILWADEQHLTTILNNLLDNAVKYSNEHHEILIEVNQDPKKSQAIISVQDQGIGISPEHQPKIFDRFYRIQAQDSQSVYGYGLGLYISKNLVEAMGGTIWVNSDPGEGSRFSFTLPLMEENISYE
jgi:PAS domain S-box-containing protein